MTLLAVITAVAGCSETESSRGTVTAPVAQPSRETAGDPLSVAAVQATAIIQRAQATALMLQAEAEATAMVHDAEQSSRAPADPGNVGAEASPSPANQPTPAARPTRITQTEVLGVGFAGEGAYIHITFRAPVGTARSLQPGMVSVTNEDTGTAWAAVPVMPKIGPLIGKPIRDGQPGYVMLVNGPTPLLPGEMVTVVLGNYTEEHVVVHE